MILKRRYALAIVIAGILAAGKAFADKPSWAGGGKGGKGQKSEQRQDREKSDDRKDRKRDGNASSRRDRDGPAARTGGHFENRHRTVVHDYYDGEFRHGRCPPGLAKKHNGCMPPGQARKWAVGRPLPREVIFHTVPPALVGQIGQPPIGHRYVRVGSDILLIAPRTGMVIDAIANLGRM